MNLDLSAIASHVDATLHTLDDALLPSANWVLELTDTREEIEIATGIETTSASIASFHERDASHFITDLKDNIAHRFCSQGVVSSFSSFDPTKIPLPDSTDLFSFCSEDHIETLWERRPS